MLMGRVVAGILLAALATTCATNCAAQAASRLSGELAWTIGYDPKTFDPAKVDDLDSETVRYLTGGVLLRFNRLTQTVEPRLAESWSVSPDGKTITFRLRAGLKFSDALPRPLAVKTLATRLADIEHAKSVLDEPCRWLSGGES